jgi:hypothetical protein
MVRSTFASSVLEDAPGHLVLRVCGTARDGQVVRLRSAKCTIGAGADCTLRLRASGVGPLHCLVLRGRQTTIVRRWSADTRLNGHAFTDASLTPGDRLSIGAVELEVVETGGAPNHLDSAPGVPDAADERRELNLLRKTVEERNRHLDEQGRELEALRADLEALRVELYAEQQALAENRRCLQAERDQAAAQFAVQAQELAKRLAEFETQCLTFEERRQQWEADQTEVRRELDERGCQLSALRTQLDARQTEIDERCRQWEANQTEVRRELDERGCQLDALQTQLDARQTEIDERYSQREAARAAVRSPLVEDDRTSKLPEGPEFPASPDVAPLGLAEVVRQAATTETFARDDGEESIDSYMTRLLARSRGDAASGPSKQRSPANPKAGPAPAPEPESRQSAAPPSAPGPHCEPVQLTPRIAPPEQRIDLWAMRELANLSARTAVNRHMRRQMLLTTRTKLFITVASIGVGGILLWMWGSSGSPRVTFYAALASFSVALLWGMQYAVLSGRLIVNSLGRLEWPSRARQGRETAASQSTAVTDAGVANSAITTSTGVDRPTADATNGPDRLRTLERP